jgi:hypothetical protein
MTDNPRLLQLLDELHESHATPEEVCRSCPARAVARSAGPLTGGVPRAGRVGRFLSAA